MQVAKMLKKTPSTVLPPKNHQRAALMADDDDSGAAVLPRRDPALDNVQSSVYLPRWMWEALEEISKATVLPARARDKKERREYTRNEVIEFFLANRIEAWRREQSAKKTPKK